ncbi:MAG: protein-disulfide reductase DsbD [Methyloglobulus sp.]|nr:protein-disulfide reductase DsbD [Methyloglobulus sp.]
MVKLKILKLLFCLLLWLPTVVFSFDSAALLPPDQAFRLNSTGKKTNIAVFAWDIDPGYHLYRQKFKFISLTPGITVEKQILPEGLTKYNELFGDVEILRGHIEVEVVLRHRDSTPTMATFEVTSQGCADAGICYLPMQKTVSVNLPSGTDAESVSQQVRTEISTPFISEQDHIADSLKSRSVWLTALGFLGFGLLLAFTPCVFPMIPILAGIVAGQGQRLTTRTAFGLSLSYVLASSLTYTVFGVLAGLFGNNLQVVFQEPWVIIAFSGIFVLLALSMFGVFQFQIPSFIQTRVLAISSRQQGGNLIGAALMGVFSTLIVGPCVTAPLAGTLIYIGQTGNAVLGGIALFALGIGMGIPLLIMGTTAGKLLPKAGAWMNIIKAIFGMGLLAVAVWLLSRIMPPSVTLYLWVFLLIIPMIILGWNKIWKGVALFVLTYGILLLAGISTHQHESLPSLLCNVAVACEKQPSLAFNKISTTKELQQKLADTHAKGKWVMLDFYADWCASCQEMEHLTFSDPRVQAALSDTVLLQADVTQNTVADKALLKQFGLLGPPATLFFRPDQQERVPYRVVGYLQAEPFLAHLRQVFE